jgi:catechol 2,3-dioxygenase-like lactoylglutathione lyase family enzyme
MSGSDTNIPSPVSIGTNDFERAAAFYDKVMPALGCRRIEEHPGAVAYGKEFPEFRVQVPVDGKVNGKPATIGTGLQVSFIADSLDAVNAFYAAALEAGAVSEGAPGRRPHYGPAYYGCFVRDPDGHKIEAMYWDATAGLEAESHAPF